MSTRAPSATIVVGLGWGDEGKGATVDALVASRPTARVVRFNGGQQALHNVVADGVHHGFSNYGAGTFEGVETWWSKYCTFDPLARYAEYQSLKSKCKVPTLYVDGECLVTTGLHVMANLRREDMRGFYRHGTTGTGFGETIDYAQNHDALTVKVLYTQPERAIDMVLELRDHYIAEGLVPFNDPNLSDNNLSALVRRMRLTMSRGLCVVSTNDLLTELAFGHTVFEGAQGFVLDEVYGEWPHTTWSNTTPGNARALLRLAGVDGVTAIGCLRTYATRHGAGPLPHEGALTKHPSEPHNGNDGAQGMFRTGLHDPGIVRWAIDVTKVDSLSVTHADVFDKFQTSDGELEFDAFGIPVHMVARGPDRNNRKLLAYTY